MTPLTNVLMFLELAGKNGVVLLLISFFTVQKTMLHLFL